MTVVAYKISVTDPELINNYTGLLQSVGKITAGKGARRSEKYWGDAIEQSLAKYYGGRVSQQAEKNVAAVPDLEITSDRVAKALARSFGADIEDVLTPEVKAKRGGSPGSTIGQRAYSAFGSGYLDQLKLLATQSQEEGLLKTDKDFGKKGKETFDVNNPEEVLKAVRAKIGGRGFFDLIAKYDPDLHKAFYNKAKNLLISKANIVGNKVTSVDVINIYFPFSNFRSPPFTTELKGKGKSAGIQYNLGDAFEKDLYRQLGETGPPIIAKSADEFTKILDSISGKKKLTSKEFAGAPLLDYEILYGVPTGGSIPRVTGKVKTGKYVSQEREGKETTTKLISSAQFTSILQDRIENKMPKLGPANPTEGLKYRTGRFVNSLQFTIDYKKQLVSYFAKPPVSEYFDKFHRRPYAVGQRLIRPTIRKTVQELFGRQFRIIKT